MNGSFVSEIDLASPPIW